MARKTWLIVVSTLLVALGACVPAGGAIRRGQRTAASRAGFSRGKSSSPRAG